MATEADVLLVIEALENAIAQKDSEADILRQRIATRDAQIASLQAQLAASGGAALDEYRAGLVTRLTAARDAVRAI